MRQLIYDPVKRGARMTIVCFISGSGTNYREIVIKKPNHNYVVFTNRPDCQGVKIAQANNHKVITLSHKPYLKDAIKRYGQGKVPRNCPERIKFEQDLCKLLETHIGGQPDLICLAGFDQWLTDWIVDRYYPRILNVHPGDTTKGYDGLHWIPSAKAILAGENAIRSTLFIVDKGEDTGPVLIQSEPLKILETLKNSKSSGKQELLEGFAEITSFAKIHGIKTYEDFEGKAGERLNNKMEVTCTELQNALKEKGDWKIYPYAVHELIAKGRVAVDGKIAYIDGKEVFRKNSK
jgi:phosphoribosylglycinamide formyltransferase-1